MMHIDVDCTLLNNSPPSRSVLGSSQGRSARVGRTCPFGGSDDNVCRTEKNNEFWSNINPCKDGVSFNVRRDFVEAHRTESTKPDSFYGCLPSVRE